MYGLGGNSGQGESVILGREIIAAGDKIILLQNGKRSALQSQG